jgi:hypothetical protein
VITAIGVMQIFQQHRPHVTSLPTAFEAEALDGCGERGGPRRLG